MNKSMNASENVETTTEQSSRRDFFKKTAAYSVSALAAASVMAPVKVKAEDDPAIMEEQPWATAWGTPVTENLYGLPRAVGNTIKIQRACNRNSRCQGWISAFGGGPCWIWFCIWTMSISKERI